MKKVFLSILLTIPLVYATSQTFISGSVSGTWTQNASPYIVVDDCIIDGGNELVIEPGVIVEIGSELTIEVYGELHAVGQENELIYFTSSSDTVYWDKIYFYNNNAELKYCKFSGAKTALYLDCYRQSSSKYKHSILNCEFSNCSEACIYVNSHGHAGYSSGSCSAGYPVQEPTISNCKFLDSKYGVYLRTSGDHYFTCTGLGIINATIINSLFNNISNDALHSERTDKSNQSKVSFINNTLIDCNRGIFASQKYDVLIANNIFYKYSIGIERDGEQSGTINNNCFYLGDSLEYVGYPDSYGSIVKSNRNDVPCDIAYNLYLDPGFQDTVKYFISSESECVDAGLYNENTFDICIPPIGGTDITDIGYQGGAGSCGGFLRLGVTPRMYDIDAFTDTLEFIVENKGTGYMEWDASIPEPDTSWLRIVKNTVGVNLDTVELEVLFNPGFDRVGRLVINALGAENSPDTILIHQGNQLPDLVIPTIASSPSSIERGAEFELSGQYVCQGNGPSAATQIKVYLSDDDWVEKGQDTLLGFIDVPSIELGETKSFSGSGFKIPPQTNHGQWYVYGVINHDSLILETGPFNNYRYCTVNIIPIKPPTGLELTGISSDIISINWQDNTDAETGYEVWRSDEGPVHESFERIYTVPANTTDFLDSTVLSDTLYYYKIRAVNSIEQSEFCEIQTIRTDQSGIKMMAWYPFNGNANDSTGNGNDGSVMNATLSLDRDSVNNRAYSFNGSDSYINIGNGVKPSYPFAISTWIYCEDFNDQDQVVIQTDSASYGAKIEITQLGKVVAGMGDGGKFVTYTTEVHLISLRNWHHIAVNYLSQNTVEVFVNGILEPTIKGSSISTIIYSADYPGSIGLGNPNIYFDGKIDEVRVYDRALTDIEINILSDFIRPTLPPVPMNLQLEALSSSEINLSWLDTYTDELWFEIFRSDAPGDNFAYLDTVGPGVTSYLDTELANNSRYHYKIRALKPEGFTSFSDTVSARTYDESVPMAPNVHCCFGEEVPPLTAEGSDLEWYSDKQLSSLEHEGDSFETSHTMPGTYVYYVTQDYRGVRGSAKDVTLTIHEVPKLTILPYDEVIEQGSEVTLTVTGGLLYKWYEGTKLLNDIDSTIQVYPEDNTNYSVLGFNANGCYDSVAMQLIVLCEPCGSETVLFDKEATINNGSERCNYRNNSNCSWTIMPSGAKDIYLKIPVDSFDVKVGDVLEVYDGLSSTGTLLGRFDNDNKPDGLLKSGSNMFIKFSSDSEETGGGFYANYWIPVGIEEYIKGHDYEVFPNPARDQITVDVLNYELLGSRLEILDLTGRVFLCLEELTMGKQTLDLSACSPGTIILRMMTDEGLVHELIIVE